MSHTLASSFTHNFLGRSPKWYKASILLFLAINPVLLLLMGPAVTGWIMILQFIFTLAMALKCYPLQPGGLIAIEAVVMGMTSAEAVKTEVFANFPVILLLMFMVAGIYFMKDLLLFVFTKILLGVSSKTVLSLLFCAVSAVLSAFLDALTVIAVIISVCTGFYTVYHKVASGKPAHATDHDPMNDEAFDGIDSAELEQFRAFLRNILMHAAVGTALGGVCTTVGEPQNLLISGIMDWDFITFFKEVAPVSMPVLVFGLLTCFLLEKSHWFSYGVQLPADIRKILENFDEEETRRRTKRQVAQFIVQGTAAVFLVIALAFHMAEVGLIGLAIIVLQTAFNGITDEHQIGKAFEEALPFTALLVVFFTIVAMIHDQHLFSGIINAVLALPVDIQPQVFFIANGVLSMISDNVFVATVYISEIAKQFEAGLISREHFEILAVAVNTGTNLPSVATPNGQAAFLFLLTSTLAPLVQLSYGRMVWMAFPYTIILSIVGYFAIIEYELLARLMGL